MTAEHVAKVSVPSGAAPPSGEQPSSITVFCDLDGPLIDVSRRYYKTYQLAIAETQAYFQGQGRSLMLTPLSASQFWQMKQERLPDADIAFCSGLRHEQIDLFLSNVLEIVNQPILLHEDRVQPGVDESLATLRQCGAKLSVVTLRCQTQAVQLLQQFHLAHYFDSICGAADNSAAYQNYAEGKQALLECLVDSQGNPPQQAWVIGDTEADILAGQALGMSTLAVSCGIRSQSYLERLEPTAVLPNLTAAVQYLLNRVNPEQQ
ncbi:MAG TPA: HAD family hydrolase [Stenomitos sp.]